MNIFTDASLNDTQKIAGIGMVFVPNQGQPSGVLRLNTHVWTDKIETAELFAIAIALSKLHPENTDEVRIVTDSDKAIKALLNIFQYPDPDRIQRVKDLVQKKILYSISASFEKMKKVPFSFSLIHGHQARTPLFSDGYYNNLADEEAELGRIEGERVHLNEIRCGNHSASLPTSEENVILNQRESAIFFPQVSFSFEKQKRKKASGKAHNSKGFTIKTTRSTRNGVHR